MKSLLDKIASRWYWIVIIVTVVFFLMAVRSGNVKGREADMIYDSLIVARDSIKSARADVTIAKGVALKLRLEKASEVAEKAGYYAEIQRLNHLRPPTREYRPVIVDVHDSISVVSAVTELTVRVVTLTEDNQRLNALADATMVQVDSVKSADRKAEMLLLDRVDSLEVALNSAETKLAGALNRVSGAATAVRRPWYKKVWSVTKETGKNVGIFIAGRASTKLVP